jgi:hypothetical protein
VCKRNFSGSGEKMAAAYEERIASLAGVSLDHVCGRVLNLEGKKGPIRHPGAAAATASIRGTKKTDRLIQN